MDGNKEREQKKVYYFYCTNSGNFNINCTQKKAVELIRQLNDIDKSNDKVWKYH